MAQTVIGMFDTSAEAQQAVQNLVSQGISRSNIDVSSSGSQSSSYAGEERKEEGGIANFFKNLFSDDDDSEKYAKVASRSGSIVTVHAQTSEQAEDAADILDDCGAVNVDERAASYGYADTGSTTGYTGEGNTDYTSTGSTSGYAGMGSINNFANTNSDKGISDVSNLATSGETKKIPIIEENLQVGKREVLTGGVRLRSRIVERPVEESLRLREENVRVERTSVNREATSADLANFEGTEIEMTERAEVPVVAKEARVVEEVSLGKDVQQRTETISDTVRRTEVDVEDLEKDDLTKGY